MNQAARKLGSVPGARSELKYLSSVLIAASRTIWQSEQVSKWRLISPSTDEESRPSKYQQIRWIVSLQLISPSLTCPTTTILTPLVRVHLPRQNSTLNARIITILCSIHIATD